MPRSGDLDHNPRSGERCRWLLTAAETGGALARLEYWVRPGGGPERELCHPAAETRVEVLSGRLILSRPGGPLVLLAGERARIPAGTPHRWRNGGEGEVHVLVELDRPGDFETALTATFAAARAGHPATQGDPR